MEGCRARWLSILFLRSPSSFVFRFTNWGEHLEARAPPMIEGCVKNFLQHTYHFVFTNCDDVYKREAKKQQFEENNNDELSQSSQSTLWPWRAFSFGISWFIFWLASSPKIENCSDRRDWFAKHAQVPADRQEAKSADGMSLQFMVQRSPTLRWRFFPERRVSFLIILSRPRIFFLLANDSCLSWLVGGSNRSWCNPRFKENDDMSIECLQIALERAGKQD